MTKLPPQDPNNNNNVIALSDRDGKRKFRVQHAGQSADSANQICTDWLIENIIHNGDEAMMIGKPGEGKTFIALCMAYHVAAGKPFAGNKTEQGSVTYITAEAQAGINKRLAAMQMQYGSLHQLPFHIITEAPDFLHNKNDAIEIAELLKDLETKFFIIDTLNRVMPGGNENAPQDMSAVLTNIQLIRKITGAASLTLHHPGWNADHARGHSSLIAATDLELTVENNRLTIRKIRDGEAGLEIAFRRTPITIGHRSDGTPITSCTVEAGKPGEIKAPLTQSERETLTLVKLLDRRQPITIGALQTLIEKRAKSGNSTFFKSNEKELIRWNVRQLEKKGHLQKTTRAQWELIEVENRRKSGEPIR